MWNTITALRSQDGAVQWFVEGGHCLIVDDLRCHPDTFLVGIQGLF